MGNFKKINIYVGAVGQAYVDKETAKNNLDIVKQNIKDWNNIIDLAQSVLDNTNPISNRLTDAQSKANAVKTLLETEMNNAINDTEKYNALKKLRDELHALDYDNDFSNGGNTYTLDQINNTLDSIVKEINDILSKSQSNLTYWEGAVAEYQQAYDTAIEVFNSYIPEDQNNPLDENDALEAQFTERLHEIGVQLQEFDTAISKVNEVSDKANQEIKKITGTTVPEEPSYTWHQGIATQEQIQSQDYVNNLTYNQHTKPESNTTITLSQGYNTFMFPESWGIPTFGTDTSYNKCDRPYTADDLGIINPEGKIFIAIESPVEDTRYIKWQ